MSRRDPIVISTEPLAAAAERWARQRFDLRVRAVGEAGWPEAIAEASGLVVRTATRVDAGLLATAPRLRVVGRAGVGLDNVDVIACRRRGVEVVYAPDANTQAVVEYVLRMVLEVLRPTCELAGAVDGETWSRLRRETCGRRELAGMTAGILGLGRIGRRVAAAMGGLGVPVLYHDLLEIAPVERGPAVPVERDELLARSDLLSIHVDGRPSNRHLVDADFLRRLRPDVLLVNTSRGFVVDGRALAGFLHESPEATAILDVHDPEPFGPDYPLLGCPNARLLPHLASRTAAALDHMSWVVRDVAAVLEGQAPRNPAPESGA